MKKNMICVMILSGLVVSSTKTYEGWEGDLAVAGVCAGAVGVLAAAGVGLAKLVASQFTAQAYYNSAKDLYSHTKFVGIYSVGSFDDLVSVVKNNIRNWDSVILSDCYVVDVYHFIVGKLENLKRAREYVMTGYTRGDCDHMVRNSLQKLERKIDRLHNQYMYLRSLCEFHPLFNQHMFIYREKERMRLEKEKMMQEAMNAANIANAIRENAKAKKQKKRTKKEETVIINNNIVVENRP